MKIRWAAFPVMLALLSAGVGSVWAADAGPTVSVNNIVFPSGVTGSDADAMKQVDEVVQRAHDELARKGLGIGNMLQHTIYLKDGAASPMDVLKRFHAAATRLAPGLKERRSVGTIIRVPDFPNKNTILMLDLVAGIPAVKGQPDDFKRINFAYGPQEIAETLAVGPIVFTAGTEAMDFQYGKLVPGIDEQIEVIVAKLDGGLKKAGLGVGNMVSHNLYVKRGTDPIHVINKFHEVTQRYAPGLKDRPSVGTLAVVDGMAADGFLLEMDAVAARPQQQGKPDSYKRVLFDDKSMPISRNVSVGDLVFLSGEEGVDPAKNGAVSPDVYEQVEVAVKKIDDNLRKSGLTIGDMVKVKLFVKKGSDAQKVREKFHEAANRLAPSLKKNPSAETLLIVEGLAGSDMKFEASVIAARRK